MASSAEQAAQQRRERRSRHSGDSPRDDDDHGDEFSALQIVVVVERDAAAGRHDDDDDEASTLGAPSVNWQGYDDGPSSSWCCPRHAPQQQERQRGGGWNPSPAAALLGCAECRDEETRARRGLLQQGLQRAEERLERLQQQQRNDGTMESEEEDAPRSEVGFLKGASSLSSSGEAPFRSPTGVMILGPLGRPTIVTSAEDAGDHRQRVRASDPSSSPAGPAPWRIAFEPAGDVECGGSPAPPAAGDNSCFPSGAAETARRSYSASLTPVLSVGPPPSPAYPPSAAAGATAVLPSPFSQTVGSATTLPPPPAATYAAGYAPPQGAGCWAAHLQRAAEGQDWLLRHKAEESRALRAQLEAVLEEVRTLRVDNARLRDRVDQQEDRMRQELELLRVSLASVAELRGRRAAGRRMPRGGTATGTGSRHQPPPARPHARSDRGHPTPPLLVDTCPMSHPAAKASTREACTNVLATQPSADDPGSNSAIRLEPCVIETARAPLDGSEWLPTRHFKGSFAGCGKAKGKRASSFESGDSDDGSYDPFCLGGSRGGGTATTEHDATTTGSSVAVASFSSPKDLEWDACRVSGFAV